MLPTDENFIAAAPRVQAPVIPVDVFLDNPVSLIQFANIKHTVADLGGGATRGSCPFLDKFKQVWCPFLEIVRPF